MPTSASDEESANAGTSLQASKLGSSCQSGPEIDAQTPPRKQPQPDPAPQATSASAPAQPTVPAGLPVDKTQTTQAMALAGQQYQAASPVT